MGPMAISIAFLAAILTVSTAFHDVGDEESFTRGSAITWVEWGPEDSCDTACHYSGSSGPTGNPGFCVEGAWPRNRNEATSQIDSTQFSEAINNGWVLDQPQASAPVVKVLTDGEGRRV